MSDGVGFDNREEPISVGYDLEAFVDEVNFGSDEFDPTLKVLALDDELHILGAVYDIVEGLEHDFGFATNGLMGAEMVYNMIHGLNGRSVDELPDVIVTDLKMPDDTPSYSMVQVRQAALGGRDQTAKAGVRVTDLVDVRDEVNKFFGHVSAEQTSHMLHMDRLSGRGSKYRAPTLYMVLSGYTGLLEDVPFNLRGTSAVVVEKATTDMAGIRSAVERLSTCKVYLDRLGDQLERREDFLEYLRETRTRLATELTTGDELGEINYRSIRDNLSDPECRARVEKLLNGIGDYVALEGQQLLVEKEGELNQVIQELETFSIVGPVNLREEARSLVDRIGLVDQVVIGAYSGLDQIKQGVQGKKINAKAIYQGIADLDQNINAYGGQSEDELDFFAMLGELDAPTNVDRKVSVASFKDALESTNVTGNTTVHVGFNYQDVGEVPKHYDGKAVEGVIGVFGVGLASLVRYRCAGSGNSPTDVHVNFHRNMVDGGFSILIPAASESECLRFRENPDRHTGYNLMEMIASDLGAELSLVVGKTKQHGALVGYKINFAQNPDVLEIGLPPTLR